MTSLPSTWNKTRVTVMGLGSFGGGVGLARYLAVQGAEVTVTDLQTAEALQPSLQALQHLPIRFVLGEHREQDFRDTDVVFVNPAVPPESPYLEVARQHQVPLDSEINLFVRQCPGRIIGITGSVGKSTTTSFLGSILQLHDARTLVGGNLGGSLLSPLPDMGPDTWVVLELSSFQLEQLAWQSYSPPLALVLNVTPNHLDRHGTMAAYQHAKEVILAHQTPADTAILNWDDPTVRTMVSCGQGQRLFYSMEETLNTGIWRRDAAVVYTAGRQSQTLFHRSDLTLHGTHNLGNAAAAAGAAIRLGVPAATIARGIQQFQGLAHRLEWIATKNGVQYYNDSKATTPLATMRAIEAFAQPLVLLAGGYDKNTPFDDLAHIMHRRVKTAIVYGATAPKLIEALDATAPSAPEPPSLQVIHCTDLETALHRATPLTAPGDVVLLSPACASYDQFPHYEARGEFFRSLVQTLPEAPSTASI
jgi:UDP-N-acetylmuramoylalanine--D-glutamate ligase